VAASHEFVAIGGLMTNLKYCIINGVSNGKPSFNIFVISRGWWNAWRLVASRWLATAGPLKMEKDT